MFSHKSRAIAVCISGSDPQYQGVVLDSIYIKCSELGYYPAVFFSLADNLEHKMNEEGEAVIYSLPDFSLFDGLVILGRQFSDDILKSITDKAKAAGIPVVAISRKIEGCYEIGFEYDDGIENIVRHFRDVHSFTRINFMAGLRGNGISDHRLDLFERAMKKFGLPLDTEQIGYGNFWAEPIAAEVERFMSSENPPEAIVCLNDSTAVMVSEKLAEMGYKIPDDVCVSGFDGIREARDYSPQITTAMPDAKLASFKAVEIIDKLLHGEDCPQRVSLPLNYSFTESCGCSKLNQYNDHKIVHRLYNQIYDMRDFSKGIIKLNAYLTGIKSVSETSERLYTSIKKAWARKTWLCVNADFFDCDTSDESTMNGPAHNGYCEEMDVLVYTEKEIRKEKPRFKTKELLPDFLNELRDCRCILFVPLHSQGKTIGYFALDYTPPTENERSAQKDFGNFHTWLMTMSGVLENVRIQNQLSSYAQTINKLYIIDPLTSLYNRRGFYKMVKEKIAAYNGEKVGIAVVSADLDNLKAINDLHGHADGDFAILSVANVLKKAAGSDGISARFGGDEFVVFLMNCDENGAEEFIGEVNSMLDSINGESGKPYRIGASCGFATEVLSPDLFLDALINKADTAMYKIKKMHKSVRE